jgi:hyperosmotically inducible periplasmic protein
MGKAMNKISFLLLGGVLAIGISACGVAKTSSEAPNTTAENNASLDKSTAQTNQDDATSETRRKQLNSDVRAAEQRSKATGEDASNKSDNDLRSQVRSKLEANLPASALAIDAKEGAVTVSGTVINEKQLNKIEPLAREISGVKSVEVKATVNANAKPSAPATGTSNNLEDHTGKNKN